MSALKRDVRRRKTLQGIARAGDWNEVRESLQSSTVRRVKYMDAIWKRYWRCVLLRDGEPPHDADFLRLLVKRGADANCLVSGTSGSGARSAMDWVIYWGVEFFAPHLDFDPVRVLVELGSNFSYYYCARFFRLDVAKRVFATGIDVPSDEALQVIGWVYDDDDDDEGWMDLLQRSRERKCARVAALVSRAANYPDVSSLGLCVFEALMTPPSSA